MPNWSGRESAKSPAQVLAQRWINRFGGGKQRYRYVALFREYLRSYSMAQLEKVIDVLYDRHRHNEITVTSPAFIGYAADDILADRFLPGKKLEII